MARRPRVETPGFHHVYNRGVERRNVFLGDKDKEKFLKILCDVSQQYRFTIHSYCLMDNHYHLLLENSRENLSAGMRQINASYAQYFNKKYKRVGHLWQDRFKSWYVLDEAYLFTLFRYIEFNPVKAGIADRIGQFEYTMSYAVVNNGLPECMKNSFVLTWYDTKELFDLLDISFTKDEEKSIDKMHRTKPDRREREEEDQKLKSLAEYFKGVDPNDKKMRNDTIVKAYQNGHAQTEIGRYLGISNVMVSKIIRRLKVKA